ncbi:MAG: Clp protease N-terminal domain-containing protein [Methyloligellaceae bacterium]
MSQNFAERLGWIPKSENLRMSMGRALTYAQDRGHAEVTLEHFLLALTEDPNAGPVFDACNINLDELREELTGYITNDLQHLVALGEGVAQPSEGFKKVMAHASAAAEQSQREHIDGAIVLAALIGEAQSHAAQILQAYGLTFEVAVTSLKNASHAASAQPAGAENIADQVQEQRKVPPREPLSEQVIEQERERPQPQPQSQSQPQFRQEDPGQNFNQQQPRGFSADPRQQPSENHPPQDHHSAPQDTFHREQQRPQENTGEQRPNGRFEDRSGPRQDTAGQQSPFRESESPLNGGAQWPTQYPSSPQETKEPEKQNQPELKPEIQTDPGSVKNIFDQRAYAEPGDTPLQTLNETSPDESTAKQSGMSLEERLSESNLQETVSSASQEESTAPDESAQDEKISSESTVEDILASVREIIGAEGQKNQEQQAHQAPGDPVQQKQASSPAKEPEPVIKQAMEQVSQPEQHQAPPERRREEPYDRFQSQPPKDGPKRPTPEELAQNWPDTRKSAENKKQEPSEENHTRSMEHSARKAEEAQKPPSKQDERNKPQQPGEPVLGPKNSQGPQNLRGKQPPQDNRGAQQGPPNRNLPPPAPGNFAGQPPQNRQHPQGMPPGQRPPQQMRGGPPPHPGGGQPPQNMPPMQRQGAGGPNDPKQAAQRGMQPQQELTKGQLIENIPRKMRFQKPVRVEVRLAKEEIKEIERGITGNAPPVSHDVMVTEAMSVRLFAPHGGFTIELGAPETQWLDSRLTTKGEGYASWVWIVTPTKTGKRPLQLGVSARIVGERGVIAHSAMPEQVISVRVGVNYGRTFRKIVGWTIVAFLAGAIGKYSEQVIDFIEALS